MTIWQKNYDDDCSKSDSSDDDVDGTCFDDEDAVSDINFSDRSDSDEPISGYSSDDGYGGVY